MRCTQNLFPAYFLDSSWDPLFSMISCVVQWLVTGGCLG